MKISVGLYGANAHQIALATIQGFNKHYKLFRATSKNAKTRFEQQQYAEALSVIQQLLDGYPRSGAAPEALFLKGVAGYKSTHDPKPLKESYEQLEAHYPSSDWTKRAYPYRLL